MSSRRLVCRVKPSHVRPLSSNRPPVIRLRYGLALTLAVLTVQADPVIADRRVKEARGSRCECLLQGNQIVVDQRVDGFSSGSRTAADSSARCRGNREPILAAEGDAPPPPLGPSATAARIEVLDHSVRGLPIELRLFGQSGDVTFVFGGIHGNEGNSAVVARRFAEHLELHPELTRNCRVAVIAAMNPDGLARNSRTNAHGVDLNRNLPAKNWQRSKPGDTFGGDQPASEPETQALIRAVELLQPSRIVSIHSISRGRQCNNFDGPGEELARRMAEKNGYPVRKTIGYSTPGSFGSWSGIDRQIPTITLELPHDQDGESAWSDNREALIELIRAIDTKASTDQDS